jgi:putative chitinase
LTTMTRLERNQEETLEYLNKIVGTPYGLWTGGSVPSKAPAWAIDGPPPPASEVRGSSCFCAGVTNLARRAVGLKIPTLGNKNFDGGIVAYFGARDPAPPAWSRRGYFDIHDRARPFDLEEARRPWTLIGRRYRSVRDQGHVAIVLPNGKLLQSYGGPGVDKDVTLEDSHFSWGPQGGYEVMVRAEDWLLPFDYKEAHEPEREEPERPEPEREAPLFTARQLSEISGNPNLAVLEKYRNALIPEMRKAKVTTPLRMAAFFGNVMVETAALNTLEEYGNETYFRYGPPEGDGLYLGNEWRYHGRGFLMNTWKDAYANLSRVLDADLVSNPDLLERPDFAAKAAMWFWERHNLNSYADKSNFKAVASIINTGRADRTPNHWTERLRFYDRAKRVLSNGPGADDGGPDREELAHAGYNRDGLPHANLAAVGPADETAAFVLAAEIRRAGIGVTVTNGADNVYALAKKIRPERLGYRQMWILGRPALEACGEYGDLANWPISPRTDYYDLAGKSLTGTCSRAAELADEKIGRGVGQRFLKEMGMADPTKSPSPIPAPRRDATERSKTRNGHDAHEAEEWKARAEPEGKKAYAERGEDEPEERERGQREERAEDVEKDRGDAPEEAAGDQGGAVLSGSLVDALRNNKALLTWFAGVAVTWLVGQGYVADTDMESMTTNLVAGILFVLGLLSRQLTYGPVTVEKNYRKKDADERRKPRRK